MKVFYDIHIHSTLSACADKLQTPNNILNMCMLKKLDMIAITDHNSLKHLKIFDELKDSYNFLFLYGVEVTVKEGYHVLCYFKNLIVAEEFDLFLESHLKKQAYDEKKYGEQWICNLYDEMEEKISYQLNIPLNLSFYEVVQKTRKLDGVVILAHINKQSSGILAYQKEIENLDVDGIEINMRKEEVLKEYPYLSKFKIIENSDAHILTEIMEKEHMMELDDLSFSSFQKYFKKHE